MSLIRPAIHAAAILAVLTLVAAPSSARPIEISVLDADGRATDEGPIRVTVLAVDFVAAEAVIDYRGDRRTLPFLQIDGPGLVRMLRDALAERRDDTHTAPERRELADACRTAARLALAHHVLDRADEWLDEAVELWPGIEPELAADRLVLAELDAASRLREARTMAQGGDLERSVTRLEWLIRDVPETVAARDASDLLADVQRQIELREQMAQTGEDPQEPRVDVLDGVEARIDRADELLREGLHSLSRSQSSACLRPWGDALDLLVHPHDGALAVLRQIRLRPPRSGYDRNRATALEARIRALQLLVYKSQAHYYLATWQFSEARPVLDAALQMAPGDRELLLLRVIHDENYIRPQPGTTPPAQPDPDPDGTGSTGSGSTTEDPKDDGDDDDE